MEENEYTLTKDSSRIDVLTVLENLIDDAQRGVAKFSIAYTESLNNDERAEAMFYMGQLAILKRLYWAYGGEAEQEGIANPTVSVG